MPNLRELNLNISYGPSHDRLREFFIPAMAASVRYDWAAGYFSSTMLAGAAAGVTKLILNGGKMRLLCGADLSEHDVAAINEGHSTLAEQVEKRLISRWVLPESDYVENRLKALCRYAPQAVRPLSGTHDGRQQRTGRCRTIPGDRSAEADVELMD
jgi:hypothetical protein